MSMNRIQFQPGMSVRAFQKVYGSEAQCEAALTQSRWPQGFVCPACGGAHAVSFRLHGKPGWQCMDCDKQTTLTSGTIFHSTKLPLAVRFLAMYFPTQTKHNIAALELKRLLGASYPAAWRIKRKLMQAMSEREADRKLAGRVEVDDAYLGGEHPGGKRGRGSENKVAFIAAVETQQGRPRWVRFDRVATFSSATAKAWAEHALAPGCETASDGLQPFRALASHSTHERIVTGRCEERDLARLPLGQHAAGQPQDRAVGDLPCVSFRQIRSSLPRRIPVPVQPEGKPEDDLASFAACRSHYA